MSVRGTSNSLGAWTTLKQVTVTPHFLVSAQMQQRSLDNALRARYGRGGFQGPQPRRGSDYDWVSGPNENYAFGSSGGQNMTEDWHRENIRKFLTMIDPATGCIAEDD